MSFTDRKSRFRMTGLVIILLILYDNFKVFELF